MQIFFKISKLHKTFLNKEWDLILTSLRKFSLYIIAFTLSYTSLFAHSIEEKDSIFNHTFYIAATELSATNATRAMEVADSLFQNSSNNTQKVKSLMLLATLNQRMGHMEKALEMALDAESINKKEKDRDWDIRIAGFLSTTLREVGLNKQGKEYLEKAEMLNKEINSSTFKIFIYQERAFYAYTDKEYDKVIQQLQQAISEFNNLPENKKDPIFLATSFELMGRAKLNLKSYRSAYQYFNLSLKELNGFKSELEGFAFCGLGEIEIHWGNYDSAFKHLQRANVYAMESDNFNLKKGVYQGFEQYYKLKLNFDKALEYNNKYLILTEQHFASNSSISDNIIQKLRSQNDNNKSYFKYALIIIILSLIGILLLLLYNKNKRNKIRLIYEEIINNLVTHNQNLLKTSHVQEPILSSEASILKKDKPLMVKETEDRLLIDLKKLEGRAFYLQKEITLSALAVKLKTNQKYASYLIKLHSGKDFNNYINELRVSYILNKFKDDPIYLDYKIAHLAEECGFSSHSKFTEVFKSQTGILPSTFIVQHKRAIAS